MDVTDAVDVPFHNWNNVGVYAFRLWHVDLEHDPDHLLTVATKCQWPHKQALTTPEEYYTNGIFGVASCHRGDLQSIGYGMPGKAAAANALRSTPTTVVFYAAVFGIAEFRKCDYVPGWFNTAEYLTANEAIPKLLWYTKDMEEEVKHLARLYDVPAEPLPEEINLTHF